MAKLDLRDLPRLRLASVLCATTLMLAACGGGGGGTVADGTTPPPVTSGSIVITTTNAKPVAADGLDNATSFETAEVAGSFVTGVQISVPGTGAAALQLGRAALELAAKVPATGALATGVVVNETMQCSLGGSVLVTGNVAGDTGMTAGDQVTLTAQACKEDINGTVVLMSGSMTIAIRSGSYDPESTAYPKRIVMALIANGFSVAAGGETLLANGDVQLDLTETSSQAASVVLTGTSLASSVTTASGNRAFTLKDYRQALAMNGDAMTLTVTAAVESSNARLGTGVVKYSVSTPTPLATNASEQFTGGSLKVTGEGSALLLTVTATDAFQLQVDTNGDGAYESTSSTTLAELRALL